MNRRAKVAPMVELLEGRALLSHVPVAAHGGAVEVAARVVTHSYVVNGTINGNYLISTSGTQNTLAFIGSGTVSPLGPISASSPATVLPAKVPNHIDLTFAADGGNLTVRFTKGSGPLNLNAARQHGKFKILGGTGLYAHASGSGTGSLSIAPTTTDGTAGTFSLALNGKARI